MPSFEYARPLYSWVDFLPAFERFFSFLCLLQLSRQIQTIRTFLGPRPRLCSVMELSSLYSSSNVVSHVRKWLCDVLGLR